MGLSSAVDWWEEWQLRILVIASQFVQLLLFLSASRRKSIISASFRVLIWLAYLGSDAMAIYALAALFNRHRKQQGDSHGESVLEVVWAPVLLMHLGGQDCITAYNMEDNELWRRHVLTAVSQVTVSIYVFCKSWPGGDKKLLQAAILLFALGVMRCLEKPFALKSASINSLVTSSDTTARMDNKGTRCEIRKLAEYVTKVRAIVQADHGTEAKGELDVKSKSKTGYDCFVRLPCELWSKVCKIIPCGLPCQDRPNPGSATKSNHRPNQAPREGDIDFNSKSKTGYDGFVKVSRALWFMLCKIIHHGSCCAKSSATESNHLPDQAQGDIEANPLPDQAQGEGDVVTNSLPVQPQGEGDVVANSLPDQALREGDIETNRLPDQAQGEGDVVANSLPVQAQGGDVVANSLPDQAHGEGDDEAKRPPDQAHGEGDVKANRLPDQAEAEGNGADDETCRLSLEQIKDQVNKLFVDLASPYRDRLSVTESFWKLDGKTAYEELQERLSDTFDLLYTKAKMVHPKIKLAEINLGIFFFAFAAYFRLACSILPFAAIVLFYKSHREAYNDRDVKVTYILLCCTAVMELASYRRDLGSRLSGTVAQYSFMGYFARNKKYTKRMSILSFLKCKEYVDQQWSMKPSNSASRITILVHKQVKGWWEQHIQDAADYTRFNNHRGQWAIQQAGCGELIGWSIKRSFDESVLLWHIATDLCFYDMGVRSKHYVTAVRCREISNYMMYLLFAKPEMLMAGTRRNLLIAAYGQLNRMLGSQEQPPVDERAVAQRLIAKVDESPKGDDLVHDAWGLAKALLELNDEKMWEVIKGVWVEMLCYSASRCRGYLHAKSLGTGGELLTFVWLLWSHLGMETLAERMQMPDGEQMPDEELPSEGNGSIVGPLIEAGSSELDIFE